MNTTTPCSVPTQEQYIWCSWVVFIVWWCKPWKCFLPAPRAPDTIFSANADVVDNRGKGPGLSTLSSKCTHCYFLSTVLLCFQLWNIGQCGWLGFRITGHDVSRYSGRWPNMNIDTVYTQCSLSYYLISVFCAYNCHKIHYLLLTTATESINQLEMFSTWLISPTVHCLLPQMAFYSNMSLNQTSIEIPVRPKYLLRIRQLQ